MGNLRQLVEVAGQLLVLGLLGADH